MKNKIIKIISETFLFGRNINIYFSYSDVNKTSVFYN